MHKEIKKIFKGNMRPTFEDATRFAKEHLANILCSCGQMLYSNVDTYQHWQMGHFDTPVYDYIEVNVPNEVDNVIIHHETDDIKL
jgi:hypothetical protein